MKKSSLLEIQELKEQDILLLKKIEEDQNISITSLTTFSQALHSTNYHYFVAKYQEEIVGYIGISTVLDTMDILAIVVKKEYQRQNIASSLLSYILSIPNIHTYLLEVRASNLPAQKLYEKFHFQKIHVRKKYYPDNLEDAYIYELKKLDEP